MTRMLMNSVALATILFAAAEKSNAAGGSTPATETAVDPATDGVDESGSTEGTEGGEPTGEPASAANTNRALVPLLDEAKTKAIRTHLGDRTVFVTGPQEITKEDGSKESVTVSAFEQAQAHIGNAITAGKLEFDEDAMTLEGIPVLIAEGVENAEKITIATLGARDKGDPDKGVKARNGYKAILVYQSPSAEDFLSSESEGVTDWVKKLIEREMADVAFSGVRMATTLNQLRTVFGDMPTTVETITQKSRESTGLDTDAFDAMWTAFRTGFLRAAAPAVEKALPTKPDVIKSIRSKAYALANPQCVAFEENGMWVKIAQKLIEVAPKFKDKDGKPTPVDASSIQEWLDGRDSLVIQYSQTVATADIFEGLNF